MDLNCIFVKVSEKKLTQNKHWKRLLFTEGLGLVTIKITPHVFCMIMMQSVLTLGKPKTLVRHLYSQHDIDYSTSGWPEELF